jgi:hypothetical protein
MAQSWEQSIDQAALVLRYGAMFEEIVWDDVTRWVDATANPHPIIPDRRLAPRLPRTINEVTWSRGRIVSVKQNLTNTKPIPGDKLAYYALEPEPGRWDGVSASSARRGGRGR